MYEVPDAVPPINLYHLM